MVSPLSRLRAGAWIDRASIRFSATTMIVVALCAFGYLLATRTGTVDVWGRPIGTDFSDVWTAGLMALDGRAPLAWDWPSHYAVQQAVHHDAAIPFYGWHYPPYFLIVASLLALLPYLPALALWQASTLAAALVLVRRILPGLPVLVPALGFPAVFVCLGHGQNGFLTATLLGGAMLVLDRRPLIAGVLIGLAAYKPQFGLLLPLFLLAGGYWRSFAAAALTVIGLTLVTLALWGPAVWIAFADSLALTRHVVGEDVATGAHKLVSAFAAVRLDGGGIGMAYLVQAIVAVAAAISVVRYAYAQTDARAAIVLCAALLATPYAFDYDLVILGVAIAFLVRGMAESGALPWEKTLLAIAYASPLLSRPIAALTGIPLGLAGVLIVWGLAIRRAERDQIIAMPPLTCSVCPVT